MAEKEKLTKEIAVFGLWTSKVEVENGIKCDPILENHAYRGIFEF